jgi:hypothetical protein
MSNINIAGRMAKKSVTRNTKGQIINLLDESKGGWIIRNGQVVNEGAYKDLLRKQEDKKEAAKARLNEISVPKEVEDMRAGTAPIPKVNIEQVKLESTPTSPSKIDVLETKVNNMENKLDAILNALKK